MHVILTHTNSDFDAVASQVAASLLWPNAVMIRSRRVSRQVQGFLALHKDRFPMLAVDEVEWARVERATVVDVRTRERLSDFAPLWERRDEHPTSLHLHLIDHHPASSDDLCGDERWIEPTGAAVTLLVEALMERGIRPEPIESTLLLLGIHADTGSLLFPSTTPRDVRAAAWLLEAGAELQVMGRYLRREWSATQRKVLVRLLDGVEEHDMAGLEIGVAGLEVNKRADGLADVTHQVLTMLGYAAIFALFESRPGRVQLIARARHPAIDVGAIARALGGGGHRAAAAALLKSNTLEEAKAEVCALLRHDPPKPRVVGELMISPVLTVPHDLPLEACRRLLEEARIHGAPVVRDGRLSGIISRRDLARAERDDRMDLTVASCMAQFVETITEDRPLEEALRRMTERDIGRLPVLRGEEIVGILTRTDVLNVLYKSNAQEQP